MTQGTQSEHTSVYRYYDRHGILIYVGITSRGIRRNREHNSTKQWWSYVDRQEVEHYLTRTEAQAREVELIRTHCPPFNTAHNWDAAAVREAYEAFLCTGVSTVDPMTALREMGGKLPLSLMDYQPKTGMALFRSRLQDSAVTMRIEHQPAIKVRLTDGAAVGSIRSTVLQGPFLLVTAELRRSLIRIGEPEAWVKDMCRKGVKVFGLKRIRLDESAQLRISA